MGLRLNSTRGLLGLGAVFVAFGVWRIVNAERTGWILVGVGVLALAAAWRSVSHPADPPEE
ncbi:MAG TPA: hypothetical protein VF103_07545 [Polyangiaceae bacterium]